MVIKRPRNTLPEYNAMGGHCFGCTESIWYFISPNKNNISFYDKSGRIIKVMSVLDLVSNLQSQCVPSIKMCPLPVIQTDNEWCTFGTCSLWTRNGRMGGWLGWMDRCLASYDNLWENLASCSDRWNNNFIVVSSRSLFPVRWTSSSMHAAETLSTWQVMFAPCSLSVSWTTLLKKFRIVTAAQRLTRTPSQTFNGIILQKVAHKPAPHQEELFHTEFRVGDKVWVTLDW